MRGKRSKQYRKLMHQYGLSFNFREPYQVLVDAEMIQDTTKFHMLLKTSLERTLHGEVKPMITQCSIRHLYNAETKDKAQKDHWIDIAKMCERRRCNHHELPEPLSTFDCITSVVDPKSSQTNKHRYVVASQDKKLRSTLREIPGVPLVYVNRSVMIMEPMAASTEEVRDREERGKIRAGLKGRRGGVEAGEKRKRDDEDDDEVDGDMRIVNAETGEVMDAQKSKKKRRKGPKQPNPLSVKKSKRTEAAKVEDEKKVIRQAAKKDPQAAEKALPAQTAVVNGAVGGTEKRKRKRKPKDLAERQAPTNDDAPANDSD
ncbi:hypothetical protein MBLNU457_7598t1 [Dothideomycetes sp. NU457]